MKTRQGTKPEFCGADWVMQLLIVANPAAKFVPPELKPILLTKAGEIACEEITTCALDA